MKINSGPVCANDKPTNVPVGKWRDLMRAKRDFIKTKIKFDCRCLLEFVSEAKDMWEQLGFLSADDMIRNGYELDPVEVEYAVSWLKIKAPEQAEPYVKAVNGGRAEEAAKARAHQPKTEEEVRAARAAGGEFGKEGGRGKKKDKTLNRQTTKGLESQKRDTAYLARRLATAAPAILDAWESGEIPSMRQAAIAAGIIRQKSTVEKALALVKKMTEAERLEFKSYMDML